MQQSLTTDIANEYTTKIDGPIHELINRFLFALAPANSNPHPYPPKSGICYKSAREKVLDLTHPQILGQEMCVPGGAVGKVLGFLVLRNLEIKSRRPSMQVVHRRTRHHDASVFIIPPIVALLLGANRQRG